MFLPSAGLVLIASIWLLVGSAVADAELSPAELPAGAIALVSQIPPKVELMSEKDLSRGVESNWTWAMPAWIAAGRSWQWKVSRPFQSQEGPRYRAIAEAAVDQFLDAADIEGEAAERGLGASQAQISEEFRQIKRENFKSRAEFRRFLHEAKLSVDEARERVRLQILSNLIEIDVLEGTHSRTEETKALSSFLDSYRQRWRARTTCVPPYATERCSNGPALGAIGARHRELSTL